MDFVKRLSQVCAIIFLVNLFSPILKADDSPPVTGDYANVVNGTENGEQVAGGSGSDHLIGLGGDDQSIFQNRNEHEVDKIN